MPARTLIVCVLAALVLGGALALLTPSHRSQPTRVAAGTAVAINDPAALPLTYDLPNARLTPGAVATTDTATVCEYGYDITMRPAGLIWRHLEEETYSLYGIRRAYRSSVDARGMLHAAYEIDWLIPLNLGGAPKDIRNLWPQTRAAAKQKNAIDSVSVVKGQIGVEGAT
jgi:hypothetical protein